MGQGDSLYKSLLQRIGDDRTEDNLTFPFWFWKTHDNIWSGWFKFSFNIIQPNFFLNYLAKKEQKP